MWRIIFKTASLLTALFLVVVSCSLGIGGEIYGQDQNSLLLKDIDHIDFANGLFQRGLYQMALEDYKQFIEKFPDSKYLHEAYFGLAESLFVLKKFQQSVAGYKKYLKLSKDRKNLNIARLRLGQVFDLLGNYDQSLKYLIKVKPDSLSDEFRQMFYFYAGRSYKIKGEDKKALAHLKKAISLKETEYFILALDEIADILSEQGKYQVALEFYEQVLKRANSKPVMSFALYKKGQMQFLSKQYSDSMQTFQIILRQYPKQDLIPDVMANYLLSMFNLEKYSEIVSTFDTWDKFISSDAKFFNVYYITARAYKRLKQFKGAQRLLDAAVAIPAVSKKDKQKVFIKRAEIFMAQEKYKQALSVIENELLTQAEDQAYIKFLQAETYYQLKNYEKSHSVYGNIRKNFADTVYASEAAYGMACSQYRLKNFEQSRNLFLDYFKQALDSQKRQDALFKVIFIEEKLDLTQDAIEHCVNFLASFNQSKRAEQVLFQMGKLYSKRDDYDQSVKVFKKFIDQYKGSKRIREAYFFLAYNLRRSDNLDDAMGYYQNVTGEGFKDELSYSALRDMAVIYFNQGKEDAAARVFDKIITEFDNQDIKLKVYLWLSKYYLDRERFKELLKVLVKIDKNGQANQRSDVGYFKAEAYRGLGDFKGAVPYYNNVLSLGVQREFFAASLIGKGICLIELRQFPEAKGTLNTALLKFPEDNTVAMRTRFELARLEEVKGDFTASSKLYMLVAILYQDVQYCPKALFKAAQIFEKLNEPQRAKKAYREIISNYPDSQEYNQAQSNVQRLDHE